MRTLGFMIRKEFIQLRRDPAMIRIAILMPLIQLLVLAYAATFELKNVHVGIYDQDRTPESRLLVDRVMHAGEDLFLPAGYASGPHELEAMLLNRQADAVLWIPEGFAASFDTRDPARLFAQIDGRNATQAGQAGGYLSQIAAATAMEIAAERGVRVASMRPDGRIVPEERFFYNPELESTWYMVPGIIVLLATIISAALTGMAVVREREIGTLEQLMVTPLTAGQMIAGKSIPFAVLSAVEMTLATVVGMLVFGIPMVGSPLLFALASLVFIFVMLSGGLLASTVSSTQQQAMFTVWFFLVISIILSGFFFPLENMPEWVMPLTWVNPLNYFMAIVRGIFLKGLTFGEMMPNLLPLLGIGVGMFAAAVLRFQKRVS
ncbi:ABC transporter permease subunit [bacterium]|nr:ABC transporter permease subunit [bacterium]